MIAYLAFLSRAAEGYATGRYGYGAVNSLLLLTLVFFHPLLIFPYLFISVYFYYFNHITRGLILKNGLVFLVFYLVRNLLFTSRYEAHSISGLGHFIEHFPHYFSLPSFRNFARYLAGDYYLLLPVLLLVVYYFVKCKRYQPLVGILGAVFGYILLINVSFWQGSEQFYMENLYLPMSLFLIIPLVFEVIPKIDKRTIWVGLILLFSIKVLHIYRSHHPYEDRITYWRNFLKKTQNDDHKKLFLSTNQVDSDSLLMTWASTYELWLLSTIETGTTRSILVLDSPSELAWQMKAQQELITPWGAFKYHKLLSKYFVLKDTSRYYFYK